MTTATQKIPSGLPAKASAKAGYKQTEIGVIPTDWDVKNLGDVCEKITTGKLNANAMVEGGEYRFYTCAKDYYRINRYAFDTEALLVSGNGANVGYVHYYKGKFNAYQRTYVLSDFSADIQYIKLFLDRNLQERIRVEVNAGNTPYITMGTLTEMQLAVPLSKTEQTAIATAVSDIGVLVEKFEKLIGKKKNIKHGVMQELLTGKRRLLGFSDSWNTLKLRDVAIFRRGSFPQPYGLSKWYDDYFGAPFIQVFDVDDNMKIKEETKRKISKEAQEMSVFVKSGSVILTIQGSIGRIAITNYDAYMDRTLLLFESFLVSVDKYFFAYVVFVLFEIEKEKAPGGIIKTITKERLSDFLISLPSLPEQTAIAKILFDMDTEIEKLESQLTKYQNIKQGMMQTLLTGKIRLLTK